MNRKKTNHSRKRTAGSGASLSQELGPILVEFLKRLGPPEEARRHFDAARVEVLKGLRAMLDARIQRVASAHAKGEKIKVE